MNSGRGAQTACINGVLTMAAAVTGLSAASFAPAYADLAKPELMVQGPRGGTPFNAPEGIALNRVTGEIVLANTNDHYVEIYSGGGRLLNRFQHMVKNQDGNLIAGLPKSVAVLGSSLIVIGDAFAPYVDVVDYRGRSVAQLKTAIAPGAGGLSAIAVTREGAILAAGPGGEGSIFSFAPDYTPLPTWGAAGSGPGQLKAITGIAQLPDGSIAVTCAQTELAVQIFDATGHFVRGFGKHDIGQRNFSLPSGVTATPDGRIWVSDELRQIIQVFTPEGKFLGSLGRGGLAPGEFLYPSALATDGGERLAVAESVGARFQVFSISEQGDDAGSEAK
jgi:tripartite motif-containing protein 71